MLYFLKYAPFYLISWIPFPVLYFLSDVSFYGVYYLVRYRREVVRENLVKSFPQKNSDEILSIEKAFYRHFCDLFFETFKLLTISDKEIRRRAKVKNAELIEQLESGNKKLIWYMSHMGNWEWFTSFSSRMNYEVITLYKRQANRYFDDLLIKLRSRFGSTMVPMKLGYRVLLSRRDSERPVGCCIIGDQTPTFKKSKAHWTQFFHQDTPFLTGAEEIARRMDMVVLFPVVTKPKRGFYEVEYEVMEYDPTVNFDLTEKYSQMLERAISESPHIWLWTHRRWKKKRNK